MPPKNPAENTNGNIEDKMKCIEHHEEFYMTGGDLYILINTTMFKIHSYFFQREAKNFFNKLLDPTSPGDKRHGTSENTAIIIDSEKVSIKEFEQFLWVFYNRRYGIYEADIEVWFSILRMAHDWDFPDVKKFALRELKRREDEIELVRRIVLYQDYKAPLEYLVPLFAQLCARPTSPTEEESKLLGFQQTMNVFRAREQLRAPGNQSPLPKGTSEADTYPTISAVLGLPEYKPEVDQSNPLNGTPIVKKPKQKNSTGRTPGN